jgi:hypothetical protein
LCHGDWHRFWINRTPTGRRHDSAMSVAPHRRPLDTLLPGLRIKDVPYRARYLVNAYPAPYRLLGQWRHRGQADHIVARNTELVIEGFGRAANTFAWLAFSSAQPRPVRVAHHTHAAAQVITAVRWNIPTLVLVRSPDDSALAHMVLRGVSARTALTAWVRYHRRVMTVRHGFVAAPFDAVTHDFGAVVHEVNAAFGTRFGVFEHTAENQARVFAAISERNRQRFGEEMTPQRALWLARPTAERRVLKDQRRDELNGRDLRRLRAHADELYRAALFDQRRGPQPPIT